MKKLNKFFESIKIAFFEWLSTGLFIVLFTSCISYYPSSYHAESILAVTSKGDTIQVPIDNLRKQYNFNTYSDWQFYYGNNNWYLWSDWRLRYPTYSLWYNDWYRPYWYRQRPYIQPKTRVVPRREVPQTRPNQPQRSRVITPRGSRNTTPQRNITPPTIKSSPKTQTRTNVGRGRNGGNIGRKQ